MLKNKENDILKYDSVIQHIIRGIRLGIYPDQSKIPSETPGARRNARP